MILVKMENCNGCINHEVHEIESSDFFEKETGIYCKKVEDDSDSWERHTQDGYVDRKIVHSYVEGKSEIAKIPSWCPLLIDSYKRIIEDIYRSPEQPIEKIDGNIIKIASYVIETLGKTKSDDYAYGGTLHGSIERDLCLIEITQLCKSQFMISEKDIGKLSLRDEDARIVKVAVKIPSEDDIKKLIEDFVQIKKKAKDQGSKPVLSSEIAVPAALYFADLVSRARYFITNIDFSFKEPQEGGSPLKTAELNYYAKEYNDDYDPPRPFDYADWAINGAEKDCILQQEQILKKIFGVETYEYYINGTRIPIDTIRKN
jgi:hypothetical protein